jgi:hypothetical protein
MTEKLPQGSVAWFNMVGDEIVKAAAQVGLPPGSAHVDDRAVP